MRRNERTEELLEELFAAIDEMYANRQAALTSERRAVKMAVNVVHKWSESHSSALDIKASTADREMMLTTKQLAERLNYSTRTIQQLKTEGLPHIGEGRATRYEIGAVVDWLKLHRKTVAAHILRMVK